MLINSNQTQTLANNPHFWLILLKSIMNKYNSHFTCDLLADADIEDGPRGPPQQLTWSCDGHVGVHLNFLDYTVKAEVPNKMVNAFCQVQRKSLGTLLAWEGLSETPRGRHQLPRLAFRDAEVPGEAVEWHRKTRLHCGHIKRSHGAWRHGAALCR